MKFAILLIACGAISIGAAGAAFAGEKTGVVVVDVQGDFTEWKNGSLAVAGTDKDFVDNIHEATKKLKAKGHPVFATRDWHPADHISFHTNHPGKNPFELIEIDGRSQVLWPPHCVQESENAKVLVDNSLFEEIVKKGKNPKYDSYSGFQDDGGKKTGMEEILKKKGITKVVIYGIATDYCVKATAIDAVEAGFKVVVIESLCRGVAPDTSEKALKEMKAKGVVVLKDLDLDKI